MGTILEVHNVFRTFRVGLNTVPALDGVSFQIAEGSLLVLRGRSGSGKTTLLNVIGGLDRPDSGQVLFKTEDLHQLSDSALTQWRRQQVGFVFQSFALMPHLTAMENVELPMRIANAPWRERRNRAQDCLRMVGLTKRARHRASELSGGEQQRVGIARAMANRPSLILADEPTGELDFETGMRVMELFREIVTRDSVTVCVATHDPVVSEFGDTELYIEDGKLTKEV